MGNLANCLAPVYLKRLLALAIFDIALDVGTDIMSTLPCSKALCPDSLLLIMPSFPSYYLTYLPPLERAHQTPPKVCPWRLPVSKYFHGNHGLRARFRLEIWGHIRRGLALCLATTRSLHRHYHGLSHCLPLCLCI